MYLIGSGCVSILGSSGPQKDTRFTSLGPGLYFGEMALLEGSVRSARAVADEDCELYVLQMDDLAKLMKEDASTALSSLCDGEGPFPRLRLLSSEISAMDSV